MNIHTRMSHTRYPKQIFQLDHDELHFRLSVKEQDEIVKKLGLTFPILKDPHVEIGIDCWPEIRQETHLIIFLHGTYTKELVKVNDYTMIDASDWLIKGMHANSVTDRVVKRVNQCLWDAIFRFV